MVRLLHGIDDPVGKVFRSLDQRRMEGVYLGVQAPGFVLDQVRDRIVEVAHPPFLANHENPVAGMNAGTIDEQVSRAFLQKLVVDAHPGLLLASPGPHGCGGSPMGHTNHQRSRIFAPSRS